MRLIWLARARIAREAAIEYIAEVNPSAALEQLDAVEQQADRLLEHPQMGRPGRVTGTRELVINGSPFILVYQVAGDAIQILHLLHTAQQWPRT